MGVLGCLALACRRQRPFCPINWLSLSALCILAYNPLELFRAGFQLSFVQVLVLVTVVPCVYRGLLHRRREDEPPPEVSSWYALVLLKLWRWAVGLALICGCAWVTALPLVLYHFQRFAPWGALQSIGISPLVILTIVLGFLTIVFGWIPVVGGALGALLRVATGWLLGWVDVLAGLPQTLVEVHPPPAWLVLTTYMIALLLIGWLWHERRVPGGSILARLRPVLRVQGTALGIAGLALLWTGWLVLSPGGTGPGYAVHVLAVGSGSATVVTTPERRAGLIDVGTMANFDAGETTTCAMRALGVGTLASLAISHANFDHFSGVPTVIEKVGVERLLVNPYFEQATAARPAVRQLAATLPPSTPPPTVIQAGDRLALGEAKLEVLWPPAGLDDNWEPNDRSLVIRLKAHGRSVLIPGDIERSAIGALLAAHDDGQVDLRSDVLIAPHHGSVIAGDTAAFYAAVSPTVIVVSTAKERPRLAPLVHETLGDSCRLISTRDAGAVTVRITLAGELLVDTYAP
jgi:competence protein ComEC